MYQRDIRLAGSIVSSLIRNWQGSGAISMMSDNMTYGNFEIELNSDYKYRRGTVVKITGVRYEFIQELIEAISPILVKETKLIKEEWKND